MTMTGKQRTQTISKGLIAALIMSWLSLTCQHCIAMAQYLEIKTANPSHGLCSHTTDKNVASQASLSCGNPGSCMSVLMDTQQAIDHPLTPHGATPTTPINLPALKNPGLSRYFQLSPPDGALFLPLEYFTVQLK